MRFKNRNWAWIGLACLFLAGVMAVVSLKKPGAGARNEDAAALPHIGPHSIYPLLTRLEPGKPANSTPAESASRNAISASKSDPSLPEDKKHPYRLRNTSLPLARLMDKPSGVLLRNALIDSDSDRPVEIPEHLRLDGPSSAHIVQARGPITPAFKKMLLDLGAEVVSYIPNNAFLIHSEPAIAEMLAMSSDVRAVHPFEPYYKIEPGLMETALKDEAFSVSTPLNVALFPGQKESFLQTLESMGLAWSREDRTPFGPLIVVDAAGARLSELARLPQVQGLEAHRSRIIVNDRTRVRLGVAPDSSMESTNYMDLSGENIWVNVNDSGVDTTHPDLAGRVFADVAATLVDTNGHGTFVGGIIAGDGSRSDTVDFEAGIPGSDEDADFRGMAPSANLFAMPVDLLTGPLQSDAYLQETAAKTNYNVLGRVNPMISNNSWGYEGTSEYTFAASSYDAAVRDALPEQTGSQSMIYVFGVGNEGAGEDDGTGGLASTIYSPATGKNVISVGAIESFRKITNEVVFTDASGNIVTNTPMLFESDSSNQVASFSARGNVGIGQEGDFGRFKPDVVAPGAWNVSLRSKNWMSETNFLNERFNRFDNQTAHPNDVLNYSLFIPTNAFRLHIQVVANNNSPIPMPELPIYVEYNEPPDLNDLAGRGDVTLPPDAALTPGDLRYAIGNDSDQPVSFDLLTILVLTNSMGDYFEVQEEINEPLAPHYRYGSGTSFAAPAVSGILALMQEYFERNDTDYSPALMKALLINGARSVNPIYDLSREKTMNIQGWGLVNLTNSIPDGLFSPMGEETSIQFQDQNPDHALATGQSQTFRLKIEDEDAQNFPLRVTLVWTDPPGNPNAASKLVNDLDLVVRKLSPSESDADDEDGGNGAPNGLEESEVYYGNQIPQDSDFNQRNAPGDDPFHDSVNNVENVYIRDPLDLDSEYEISVIARRVNVNAVTEHPDDIVQDFALVVSSGNLTLTNGFTVTREDIEFTEPPSAIFVTNGVPVLNQRVGANSPLSGGAAYPNDGVTNQWQFFVFTNFFDTNLFSTNAEMASLSTLTNGSNVAFITFIPPNLAEPSRQLDSDIDLYVSRDSNLTNLAPAVLETSRTNGLVSLNRGGTEVVTITNAPVGEDVIYYIGVKAEDQQAAEYGFVTLSSDTPFEGVDSEGNSILQGLPINVPIPDGSPSQPGGNYVFAVGTSANIVGNVVPRLTFQHENLGDVIANLSHNGAFSVLNNHNVGGGGTNQTHFFEFEDISSGFFFDAQETDQPGKLTQFFGMPITGLWLLTVEDNALTHAGSVVNLSILVEPSLALVDDSEIEVTVLPNRFKTYLVNLPADVSRLTAYLTQMDGNVDLFFRKNEAPTVSEFDKMAALAPPSGSLSISTNDVPPVSQGRWFIGAFNPNAVPVTFNLRIDIEQNLDSSFSRRPTSDNPLNLSDDARSSGTINVEDRRPISDLEVGVRVNHPRVSDLAVRLTSPSGESILLTENRGGLDASQYGSESVSTNFHHVALTYDKDSGTASVYLDGEAVASQEIGSFTPDTRGDIYIGATPGEDDTVASQYLGTIDEVSLYDRALFAGEIRSIARFGLAGKTTNGLAALWPFDGSGADALNQNSVNLTNVSYELGQSLLALKLSDLNQFGLVENPSNLDLGAGDGFTIDAWINPSDLTEERPILAWAQGTNSIGVQLRILPGEGLTNAAPGVLSAVIPELNGDDEPKLLEGLRPGLIMTNGVQSNFVYTVFTEDTNEGHGLIKFASPPYATNVVTSNRFIGGFESPSVPSLQNIGARNVVDGWIVQPNPLANSATNPVALLNLPELADTGTQFLALRNGSIARTLPTRTGQDYELRFSYRQQHTLTGLTHWWTGDNTLEDSVGGSDAAFLGDGDPVFVPGAVGDGFFLTGTNHLEISAAEFPSLTNEFSVELWYNQLTPGASGLIGKSSDGAVNFAMGIDPDRGLGMWFDDPAFTGQSGDGDLESVRLDPAPVAGALHHIVGTFQQIDEVLVELNIYVDGEPAASRLLLGNLANTVNGAPVTIGAASTEGDFTFGILDEVTFYDRALAPEEAKTLHSLGSLGKCPYPCFAQAMTVIDGTQTNVFSGEMEWKTNAISFTATSAQTLVAFQAVNESVLLDSIELAEVASVKYASEETLDRLIGEQGFGEWSLKVFDTRSGPESAALPSDLVSWQLNLTFAPTNYPAISLTNDIPYRNTLPAGGQDFFIVDVPRSAQFATNIMASASLPLTLTYAEDGLPIPGLNDLPLLLNEVFGQSVISETNGTFQVDTNGMVFDETSLPTLSPGQRYFLSLINPFPQPVDYSLQVNFDALDTNITGLVTLNRNETIITNITEGSVLQYYRYNVSTNAQSASFELIPLDGDANLYIRRAQLVRDPLPTPSQFDFASENPGAQQEVILVDRDTTPPLTPGDWYLGVLNRSTNAVNYLIRVVEDASSGGTNVTTLTDGVPVTVTLAPSSEINEFFLFTINGGEPEALFEVYDMDGDVDLYALRDGQPTTGIWDYLSINAGLSNEQIIPRNTDPGLGGTLNGDWYLGVFNQEATPVAFTIRASLPVNGMLVSGNPLNLQIAPAAPPQTGLEFTWDAVTGETYRLDTSTDLVNWTELQQITASGTTASFIETGAMIEPRRFYRLIQIP